MHSDVCLFAASSTLRSSSSLLKTPRPTSQYIYYFLSWASTLRTALGIFQIIVYCLGSEFAPLLHLCMEASSALISDTPTNLQLQTTITVVYAPVFICLHIYSNYSLKYCTYLHLSPPTHSPFFLWFIIITACSDFLADADFRQSESRTLCACHETLPYIDNTLTLRSLFRVVRRWCTSIFFLIFFSC